VTARGSRRRGVNVPPPVRESVKAMAEKLAYSESGKPEVHYLKLSEPYAGTVALMYRRLHRPTRRDGYESRRGWGGKWHRCAAPSGISRAAMLHLGFSLEPDAPEGDAAEGER
jgi:hypothetical protein